MRLLAMWQAGQGGQGTPALLKSSTSGIGPVDPGDPSNPLNTPAPPEAPTTAPVGGPASPFLGGQVGGNAGGDVTVETPTDPFAGVAVGGSTGSGGGGGRGVVGGAGNTFDPARGGFDANGQWHDAPGSSVGSFSSQLAPFWDKGMTNMAGAMSPWITGDAGPTHFQAGISPRKYLDDQGILRNWQQNLSSRFPSAMPIGAGQ